MKNPQQIISEARTRLSSLGAYSIYELIELVVMLAQKDAFEEANKITNELKSKEYETD